MPMGQTPFDLKALPGNYMVLTSQGLTNHLDGLFGEIGEIGQCLVLYLAILAVGASKEMGLIDLILVLATSSSNMHGPTKALHLIWCSYQIHTVTPLVSTRSASC